MNGYKSGNGQIHFCEFFVLISAIPSQEKWNLNPDASYVYYCDNETVNGGFMNICVVVITMLLHSGYSARYKFSGLFVQLVKYL